MLKDWADVLKVQSFSVFLQKGKFMSKKNKLNDLPTIGEFYHFWDDGKVSVNRHYICRVERILSHSEAKTEVVYRHEWDDVRNELLRLKNTLYDVWKEESAHCDWLFAENTDYFIEISCPNYDENKLWCVRTKEGGWFSMDIQTSWQGGRLDVGSKIFNSVVDMCLEEGWGVTYEEANEENWKKNK